MAWRVGVDSGGTFTDVCLFDERDGRIAVWKLPSTPHDPSEAIAGGAMQAVEGVGAAAADIAYFGHGTTVGTNALIQHRGVRTGLITTDGFRDLLEIGRQKRPHLYDLQVEKEPVLAARDLRIEIAERRRHDGRVKTPLDTDALRAAIRTLRERGAEAVAICFLYGYIYPEHEEIAQRILAEEMPGVFACASHEVAPEFREYERMSTTVVNAYLGPVMESYIARLGTRLAEAGITAPGHLTQSNGGVISFDAAARLPVRTILSGPATGVVAAQEIGRLVGIADLITFDMGGTSTDVALLLDGECRMSGDAVVHGYPIKAPMLDIQTVGAGGGSIAHIDSGGLLKVGPRSAGAVPGPVCYDRGNTEATVTDANVVLGMLNPTHLLGGRLPIRADLAQDAIAKLAGELGMDVMETAEGILAVVIANMARAIRVISVQRGYDPRDYTLVAFGGAGPLHAARLAQELEMPRILVPRNPGILCAMGLLLTDLRADFSTTRLMVHGPGAMADATAALAGLAVRAEAWFAEEHIAPPNQRLSRAVDMRYAGQNYELRVPVPDGALDADSATILQERFEAEHKRIYGFTAPGEAIQLVTFRAEATGVVRKASFPRHDDAGPDATGAITGERQVWSAADRRRVACPVYDREKLRAGNRIIGPAIIEQLDATTVIPRDMVATVEPYLNIIMEAAR